MSVSSGPPPAAREPLEQPVQYLKGVGPNRARSLGKLGVHTTRDLIEHVPRRHADYSRFKPIREAVSGQLETLQGTVSEVRERHVRRGMAIVQVFFTDGTGVAAGVWFNQGWMGKRFPAGTQVIMSGTVQRKGGLVEITQPEYEVIDPAAGADPINTGRVVPIYPMTEGLGARELRRIVYGVLDEAVALMPDPVPPAVRRQHGLLAADQAWRGIHFPEDLTAQAAARRTLAFEELFVLQVGLAVVKSKSQDERHGIAHGPDGEVCRRFAAGLPYRLTNAQQRVIAAVRADMESPRAMNRLVQGDVGSGKTMVAAAALAKAADSGLQGAMMAPTEILAEQHYINLRHIFEPLGVEVVLLTGSLTKRQKEEALARIQGDLTGYAPIVVGTHALLEEGVRFRELSLVITDEQHRFGVRQRLALQTKARRPDVLVMTATPIPRTLALTLYGDLDVSVIDEMPPGRKPIETVWKPELERHRFYNFLRDRCLQGEQGYVVCPLVEESEKLQAEAATQWLERLQQRYPMLRFGLLHGRMRPNEKDAAMEAFRAGETQVLVATTVVEVGVDVPNATVMVIEGADHFGLAQLHQLRGRVGRGPHQSYCLLVSEAKSDEARQRMMTMQRTSDGFQIAEADLEMRGPGEFFGTRQHGLPDLKVANPIADLPLLEAARPDALALVAADPGLRAPEHAVLRRELLRRFGAESAFGLILVS